MEIRIATKSDIEFILRGVQENARLSFPNFKKNQKTETVHRRRIAEAISDKHQKIWIALFHGIPCGFLWIILSRTEISLERFGYMQSLWVHKKFRRRGIAGILLEATEQFLRTKKYPKIRSTYTVSNLSIEKFLKLRGFKIRRILAEKRLR